MKNIFPRFARVLSFKNLRPESAPLNIKRIWQIICNYRTVDAALGLNPVKKLLQKFAGKHLSMKIWRTTMWTGLSRTTAFDKEQFSLLITVVPFIACQNIKKSLSVSKILAFYIFFIYETSSMLLRHLYNVFYVFNPLFSDVANDIFKISHQQRIFHGVRTTSDLVARC